LKGPPEHLRCARNARSALLGRSIPSPAFGPKWGWATNSRACGAGWFRDFAYPGLDCQYPARSARPDDVLTDRWVPQEPVLQNEAPKAGLADPGQLQSLRALDPAHGLAGRGHHRVGRFAGRHQLAAIDSARAAACGNNGHNEFTVITPPTAIPGREGVRRAAVPGRVAAVLHPAARRQRHLEIIPNPGNPTNDHDDHP
jgi:hypothetical protein